MPLLHRKKKKKNDFTGFEKYFTVKTAIYRAIFRKINIFLQSFCLTVFFSKIYFFSAYEKSSVLN